MAFEICHWALFMLQGPNIKGSETPFEKFLLSVQVASLHSFPFKLPLCFLISLFAHLFALLSECMKVPDTLP